MRIPLLRHLRCRGEMFRSVLSSLAIAGFLMTIIVEYGVARFVENLDGSIKDSPGQFFLELGLALLQQLRRLRDLILAYRDCDCSLGQLISSLTQHLVTPRPIRAPLQVFLELQQTSLLLYSLVEVLLLHPPSFYYLGTAAVVEPACSTFFGRCRSCHFADELHRVSLGWCIAL